MQVVVKVVRVGIEDITEEEWFDMVRAIFRFGPDNTL
jgi:hypothetical protein